MNDFKLELQIADPAHVQIERFFQRQIQSGNLKAGQRLPSNLDLARRWGVSCTVVQKAFARLSAAGMLARAPRRGTFVQAAEDKAVIGILFGPSLAEESAHFYRAILKALNTEIEGRQWTLRVYDGLTSIGEEQKTRRTEGRRNLFHDLTNYGFKGLIEIAPDPSWSSKVEAQAGLPIAQWGQSKKAADLDMDNRHFGHEGARHLAGHGCRNLVYLRSIWHRSERTEDLDGFLDSAREHGLPPPRVEQIQLTGDAYHLEQEPYERTLRLLERWKAEGRPAPDGFLVNDDITMRGVALALVRAGVRVPEEVRVVTFTSEEVRLHYGIPVERYEFSTRRIASELLGLLWRRLLGQTEPPLPILIRGRIREASSNLAGPEPRQTGR